MSAPKWMEVGKYYQSVSTGRWGRLEDISNLGIFLRTLDNQVIHPCEGGFVEVEPFEDILEVVDKKAGHRPGLCDLVWDSTREEYRAKFVVNDFVSHTYATTRRVLKREFMGNI